jgi:hypothetical protein
MSYLHLLGAIFLVIGILDLPYGYYQFLRLIITAISVLSIYHYWENYHRIISIILFIIAILFNPILPIHLEKETWVIIDLLAGLFFGGLLVFRYRKLVKTGFMIATKKIFGFIKIIFWPAFIICGIIGALVYMDYTDKKRREEIRFEKEMSEKTIRDSLKHIQDSITWYKSDSIWAARQDSIRHYETRKPFLIDSIFKIKAIIPETYDESIDTSILFKSIGKYPFIDHVLDTLPYFSNRLQSLLGVKFDLLKELIFVQFPLHIEDQHFVTTGGCKQHLCTVNDAIVIYDLLSNNIIVGMRNSDTSMFYSEKQCGAPNALIKWETEHH